MTEIERRPRPPLAPADLIARVDAGDPFPIVESDLCTFAFNGPAIGVRLVHFGVGLPTDLSFELLDDDEQQWPGLGGAQEWPGLGGAQEWAGLGGAQEWAGLGGAQEWAGLGGAQEWAGLGGAQEWADLGGAQEWWLLTLALPYGSRLEYKLEITDSFGTRLIEDPLNPRTASHPFGANSVCEATGYETPDWAIERGDVPRGTIRDVSLDSAALGRPALASVYLPAGYTDGEQRCPLVIVHDGPDYLRYAGASTVLDNLIHGGLLPPTVVAFLHPAERLVEYAGDPRHHRYLTDELVPRLETELAAGGEPAMRCLVGASFGAVAALSAAVDAPGTFGRLLLQSGSFAGAGVGCWPRPEGLWRPIKQFIRAFLANPAPVAERIYVSCGVYESLICENRGLVPVLESTGMEVTFDESLDGHNWASWRDRLGSALPALLASARG